MLSGEGSALRVTVIIPAVLRQYTHNNSEIQIEASTVEEALLKLNQLFPGLGALILDERKAVRPFVNIFVNEDSIRNGMNLMTRLKDGDHVHIIPAIAGG